jgi:hypothetical protein
VIVAASSQPSALTAMPARVVASNRGINRGLATSNQGGNTTDGRMLGRATLGSGANPGC